MSRALMADRKLRVVLVITTYVFISLIIGLLVCRGSNSPIQLVLTLFEVIPALVLALRNSTALIPYLLSIWAFSPEIRRIYDWSTGAYHPITILSLVPLLCTLVLIIPIARDKSFRTPSRLGKGLTLFFLVVVYGVVIGMFRSITATSYAFLQFCAPMLLALYVVRASSEQRDRYIRCYVYIALILSVYALIQFTTVPPWDSFWMTSSQMGSIGIPTPYKLRAFSTLNSPAVLAAWLSYAILPMIVNSQWRGRVGIVGVFLIVTSLAVTEVRTSWIQLLVQISAYAILSKGLSRWKTVFGVLSIAVVFTILMPMIPGAQTVSERLGTLGSLSTDRSFQSRINIIVDSGPVILHTPLGRGIGSIGEDSVKLTNESAFAGMNSNDNGILASFAMFGWVGGLIYFWVLLRIGFASHRDVNLLDRYVLLSKATMVAFVVSLTSGGSLASTVGLIVWMFVSLQYFSNRKVNHYSMSAIQHFPVKTLTVIHNGGVDS